MGHIWGEHFFPKRLLHFLNLVYTLTYTSEIFTLAVAIDNVTPKSLHKKEAHCAT